MDMHTVQVTAGLVSSGIFAASTATMLLKTVKTKNVESYSLSFLILSNVGNLIYWLYVFSLPFGPIYMLHGFYTIAMIVMLICYALYLSQPYHHHAPADADHETVTSTQQMAQV